MFKKIVLVLGLISSAAFAQGQAGETLAIEFEVHGFWEKLTGENSILPVLDMGTHFRDPASFGGIEEVALLSMAISAIEEVMMHPPTGVKLEARDIPRHLKIIITHSQSQTEIGQLAHENFNRQTMTGGSVGNEDAMTVMALGYKKDSNEITAIDNMVVVYLDKIFERAKEVHLPSRFKDQEPEAESMRAFQYLITVLAHEIYGNAVANFGLEVDKMKLLHQFPSSARRDGEVHAYSQGLQFLKEVNDDHGFRIADRYNRWKPGADVLADHACYINGLLIKNEKRALAHWKKTK